MKSNQWATISAMLVVILGSAPVRADESKVAVKAVRVLVPAQAIRVEVAVEAKPVAGEAKAKPEPVKADLAKKPKAPAVAIEVEALAAPFVKALEEKLDLKPANDPQVQQFIPHFTQQFRPALLAELNFIRQTCDLVPAQRPKIKAVGEEALAEAVRAMAQQQVRQDGNVVQRDGRRIIRDALAKVLKETLTPEQMEKYTDEATRRAALRKKAAILNVVARLDSTMCLTQEQRQKITESISSAWQEKWEQWLVMSVYGDQYVPIIPDNLLVGHLNADQKAVWTGLQKVDFTFWGGGGEVEQNDGWWGDEPAKKAMPRAGGIGFF